MHRRQHPLQSVVINTRIAPPETMRERRNGVNTPPQNNSRPITRSRDQGGPKFSHGLVVEVMECNKVDGTEDITDSGGLRGHVVVSEPLKINLEAATHEFGPFNDKPAQIHRLRGGVGGN